jgi:Lar family restriction alleviation protein
MGELKPCPFCGAEGVAAERSEYGAFATCADNECAVVTRGYDTLAEAMAAWNRRVGDG